MTPAPCYECPDRAPHCHGSCDKYQEYLKERHELYIRRAKENAKWIIHK